MMKAAEATSTAAPAALPTAIPAIAPVEIPVRVCVNNTSLEIQRICYYEPDLCSRTPAAVMVGDTTTEAIPVVVLPVERLSVLMLVVCTLTAAMESGNPAAEQYPS